MPMPAQRVDMFTGLIQKVGTVAIQNKDQIGIKARFPMKCRPGDSIAVNGVCLTLTGQLWRSNTVILFFDISKETLSKTTLGNLPRGSKVNIERALTLKNTLGGHIVQGHVDGVGSVAKITPQKDGRMMYFEAPAEVLAYVVPKGSVTVDGVSLTAVSVKGRTFSTALIPFTLTHTTLGKLKKGDKVNLEADIIGKYVAKYLKKK